MNIPCMIITEEKFIIKTRLYNDPAITSVQVHSSKPLNAKMLQQALSQTHYTIAED
jgi:hypothetical protein